MKTQPHIYVSLPVSITNAISQVASPIKSEIFFGHEEKVEEKDSGKEDDQTKKAALLKSTKKLVETTVDPGNIHTLSPDEIKEQYSSWLTQQQAPPTKQSHKKQWMTVGAVLLIASSAFVLWRRSEAKTTVAQSLNKVSEQVASLPAKNISNNISYDLNEQAAASSIVEKTSVKNNYLKPVAIKPVTAKVQEAVPVNKTAISTSSSTAPVIMVETKKDVEVVTVKKPVEQSTAIVKPVDREITPAAIPASFPKEVARVERPQPQRANTVPLTSLVDVQGNYFTAGNRGISYCDVTINNRSNEILKLAAVDVYYLNARRSVINKKTIYFSNVQPQSKMTVRAAPDRNASLAEWQLGLVNSANGIIYYAKQ